MTGLQQKLFIHSLTKNISTYFHGGLLALQEVNL
jgi:hypothetical protein